MKAQILAGGRGKGIFSSGLEGGVKVTQEYVITDAKFYCMIHYEYRGAFLDFLCTINS